MPNDKPSPKSVQKVVDADAKKDERHRRDLVRVREEGFRDGQKKGRSEILDWLQDAYTGAEAPERGTPEAEAILELAREAAKHFLKLGQ